MNDFNFETKTIDYLIDRVEKSKITKLKIACEDFEMVIESDPFKNKACHVAEPMAPAVVDISRPDAGQSIEDSNQNVVRAPIVGTFYSTPAPGKPPFVSVGDKINKGDVIYIIESMKLMNEVKSEFSGTLKEILVESGQSVEYGQPIMIIE